MPVLEQPEKQPDGLTLEDLKEFRAALVENNLKSPKIYVHDDDENFIEYQPSNPKHFEYLQREYNRAMGWAEFDNWMQVHGHEHD